MSEQPTILDFPGTDRDRREITALITAIESATNGNDNTGLERVFAADAVQIAPNGKIVRGWDELSAYHKMRLSGPASDWRISAHVLDIGFMSADSAIAHIRLDISAPDGGFSNHGTVVVNKANGSWWISAYHNSRVAA